MFVITVKVGGYDQSTHQTLLMELEKSWSNAIWLCQMSVGCMDNFGHMFALYCAWWLSFHSHKQRLPKWHFVGSSWISEMHGSVLWELLMSGDAHIHLTVCDSKQNFWNSSNKQPFQVFKNLYTLWKPQIVVECQFLELLDCTSVKKTTVQWP